VQTEQRTVAIVTGGATGIGAATARRLVAMGTRVVIADVQDDQGRALARVLGPACSYVHANASLERDMHELITATREAQGRIDCIFNSAGTPGPQLGIADITPETWDAMVAVLLRSVYLGMHFAAEGMRRQGGGSIVSTAAISGLRVGWGSHVAAAANAAIIQLTRSVAMELADCDVRVNCICPSSCDDETVAQKVAAAATWLAGENARRVSGQVLVIDDGRRSWRSVPPTS